jgi:hypothetical protein
MEPDLTPQQEAQAQHLFEVLQQSFVEEARSGS